MKKLRIEDFEMLEKGSFETKNKLEVWNGLESYLGVEFLSCPKEVNMENLIGFLPCIENYLEWLEESRERILDTICKEMLNLANEWVEDCESKIVEGVKYFETGLEEYVALPITKEAFLDSLYLDSFCITIKKMGYSVGMWLMTKPNYFAGHSILAAIDKKEIEDITVKLWG